MSKRTSTVEFFPILGLGPLWILLVTFISQTILLSIGSGISNSATILSILSVAILPTILFRSRDFLVSILTIGSSIAIFAVCFFVASSILDTSFDGQTYHQLAVDYLKNGWNYFYFNSSTVSSDLRVEYSVPLNHYPKFSWLIEASMFKLTGNLEGSKSLNLVLMFCSAVITQIACKTLKLSTISSTLLTTAFSLNPVTICQLWTFYIDGVLASITLILFGSIAIFLSNRSKFWAHASGVSLLILLQIKFTALVIIASIMILVISIAILKKCKDFVFLTKLFTGYLLIAIFLVGFHPYVTNLIATGNPVYPVAGYSPFGRTPEPKDWPIFPLVDGQQPISLRQQLGPVKLALSIFSRTVAPVYPESKILPFWEGQIEDYNNFTTPDLRLGAFGPIFPVCLLFAVLAFCSRRVNYSSHLSILLGLTILLAALINPESWWARYAPQVWLLPTVLVASSDRVLFRNFICAALSLNSLVILVINTNEAHTNSIKVSNALATIASAKSSKFSGSYGNYYANRLRLQQLGISISREEDCPNRVNFAGSNSYVCLNEP